mmetsp:Transcript_7494/g.12485  ORF Transcript_7494/g.12485 Transcript_7494/m.12485 type:complete len:138 (-) Transcript_7494:45-458(-)
MLAVSSCGPRTHPTILSKPRRRLSIDSCFIAHSSFGESGTSVKELSLEEALWTYLSQLGEIGVLNGEVLPMPWCPSKSNTENLDFSSNSPSHFCDLLRDLFNTPSPSLAPTVVVIEHPFLRACSCFTYCCTSISLTA